MDKIFNTLLLINQKSITKYGRKMAEIYRNQNVNYINLDEVFTNNGGFLFICNHINNIETIDDFINSKFDIIFETLIKDSIILAKSMRNNLRNTKKMKRINIIYFPSYNKQLYGKKFLENIYENSTTLLNNIFESSKFINDYNCYINVIYSYKSTNKIIELLKNKEIVFIFYVSDNILRLKKFNLFLNNSYNTLIPIKITKNINLENNYIVEKYDTFHDYIDNEDLNDIKNFLFN